MTKKDLKMNAAELLVRCLETEGVQYIFGVPGEENLSFLEALRTSKIKLVVTRNEQGAVFMASTIGRMTSKIGVAFSTLGPGATNLMTGVAYATLGAIPLLVITGQKPIRKSKQGKFQIIDTVGVMKPLTKFSKTILNGNDVPSVVREAVDLAEAERLGAVHIELSEDVALDETTTLPIIPEKVERLNANQKSIDVAVKAIESAKSPIVLIASGGNRKWIRTDLEEFLNKTKIPFVTTQLGKGVIDEDSILYMGTTALSKGDYVHKILLSSDLIIVLGHDTIEKPPIVLSKENINKPKILHINFLKSEYSQIYIPDIEVVGDISNTLSQITKKITPQKWNFLDFNKVRKAQIISISKEAQKKDFPIIPERVVADVQKVMPKDGILSLDNGMYKIWFTRNYLAHEQNSLLVDNTLATMGAGLSVGIALKLLDPKRKVLVVAGDGGFMMNIAELETSKRFGINLTVLILNDSGFGMIKWKQKDMALKNFGLEFSNPDFVKLAESFGAKGYRITKADELAKILKKCLDSKGINIVECPIDYTKTNDALGKNLQEEINNIK